MIDKAKAAEVCFRLADYYDTVEQAYKADDRRTGLAAQLSVLEFLEDEREFARENPQAVETMIAHIAELQRFLERHPEHDKQNVLPAVRKLLLRAQCFARTLLSTTLH